MNVKPLLLVPLAAALLAGGASAHPAKQHGSSSAGALTLSHRPDTQPAKPVKRVKPAPKTRPAAPPKRHSGRKGLGRLVDVQGVDSIPFTEHRKYLAIEWCTERRDYCKVTDIRDGREGYAIGEDLGLTVLTPQEWCAQHPEATTGGICTYPAHH